MPAPATVALPPNPLVSEVLEFVSKKAAKARAPSPSKKLSLKSIC